MTWQGEFKWDKSYKNEAEYQFALEASAEGHRVTKRGWPDFICYKKDGTIMLVEVKKNKKHGLRKSQMVLMEILSKKYGVPCYRWSPDNDWLSGGRKKMEN